MKLKWNRSSGRELISDHKTSVIAVIILAIFGATWGLFRLTFSQAEDMGFFLSITSFVANGQRLYSEVFEIKDPLFFYTAATFMNILGPKGPYFADMFVFTFIGPAAFCAARVFGFARANALVASTILILAVGGVYYQSFRTTIFSLFFVVLVYLSAGAGRFFLAGLFCIIVAGFKLPFILLCLPVSVFIWGMNRTARLQRVFQFALGVVSAAVILVSTLLVRGEFIAYLDSIVENFNYSGSYLKVIGRPEGIPGHILTFELVGIPLLPLCIALIVVTLGALFYLKRISVTIRLALVGLIWAVICLLLIMAMWPHHFHPLALVSWAVTLLVLEIFSEVNQNRGQSMRSVLGILLVFGLTLSLVTVVPASGTFPQSQSLSADKLKESLKTELVAPPELTALFDISNGDLGVKKVARLGTNDDLGLGAFLPHSWSIACPRWNQVGFESEAVRREILNCLSSSADYLVISPGFYSIHQGNLDQFRQEVLPVIEKKFQCRPVIGRASAYVCKRL